MVLRQLPQMEKSAPGKPTLESVHLARQAVQLDVEDGTSWCECLDMMMHDLIGAQIVTHVCVSYSCLGKCLRVHVLCLWTEARVFSTSFKCLCASCE